MGAIRDLGTRGGGGAGAHPRRSLTGVRRVAASVGVGCAALATIVVGGNAGGTPVPRGPAPGYTPLSVDVAPEPCTGVPTARVVPAAESDLVPHVKGAKAVPNAVVEMVYVGDWNTPEGQSRMAEINAYARYYTTAPIQGVLAQDGVRSATFGGSVVLDQFAPSSADNVMDEEIASQLASGVAPQDVRLTEGSYLGRGARTVLSELGDALAHIGRSDAPGPQPEVIYNLVYAPGTELINGWETTKFTPGNLNQFAAEHGSDSQGDLYTASVWPTEGNANNPDGPSFPDGEYNPNPLAADQQEEINLAHELIETQTDPYGSQGQSEEADLADDVGLTAMCDENGQPMQPIWSAANQDYRVQP